MLTAIIAVVVLSALLVVGREYMLAPLERDEGEFHMIGEDGE